MPGSSLQLSDHLAGCGLPRQRLCTPAYASSQGRLTPQQGRLTFQSPGLTGNGFAIRWYMFTCEGYNLSKRRPYYAERPPTVDSVLSSQGKGTALSCYGPVSRLAPPSRSPARGSIMPSGSDPHVSEVTALLPTNPVADASWPQGPTAPFGGGAQAGGLGVV